MTTIRHFVKRRGSCGHDAGSVSVEAAMGVLAIMAVLLMVAWCTGLLLAQLAIGEAARAAVRVAARGDDAANVIAEAQRLVPGAQVFIDHIGPDIHVVVSQIVTPPGSLVRLGSVRLSASSVAADESQP